MRRVAPVLFLAALAVFVLASWSALRQPAGPRVTAPMRAAAALARRCIAEHGYGRTGPAPLVTARMAIRDLGFGRFAVHVPSARPGPRGLDLVVDVPLRTCRRTR